MDGPAIVPISSLDRVAQRALLNLNNAHASQTSLLTPEAWRTLIGRAFAADCASGTPSLLIAFDQDADYDSPNYRWFCRRRTRFVYVDRIVVAESHRGRGLASRLYRRLFEKARSVGHDHVVCEVNIVPANPGSDAFHANMGFQEIGRTTLADGVKTVRYLERLLDEETP